MPVTHFPYGIQATPVIGANLADIFQSTPQANSKNPIGGNVYFVDGDNGSDGNSGNSPASAKASIGGALAVSGPGAVIYVKARNIPAGGTDPVNYAETNIIAATQPGTKIIGIPSGLAQGAQPQIKIGSGSTAMFTVRAPGCMFANLTINMTGSTGGGILLDDDSSTKTAFGTCILGCVFKGTSTVKSNAPAAISIGANGGAWQLQIKGNHFVDCGAGINALGTTVSPLKDITIEDNIFYAFANADVDADINFNVGIYGSAIIIRNNVFGTVDVPAMGSGHTDRYIDLTGCTNSALVGNVFACIGQGTSAKTFGASGTGALIPTTCRMAGNFGEVGATATTGEILRT
jgi:hypothetical protein